MNEFIPWGEFLEMVRREDRTWETAISTVIRMELLTVYVKASDADEILAAIRDEQWSTQPRLHA